MPARALSLQKWRVAAFAVAAAVAIAALAGPQESFDQIYGGRLKAATTTTQKLQLAKVLLTDAAGLKDDKPFQAFVYEKVYDLTATEPPGYSTAYQAMDELAKAQPDRRAQVDEKLTVILERESRTGSPAERQAAAAHYLNRSLSQAEDYQDAGDNERALAALQKAVPIAQIAGRERSVEFAARIKDIRTHQLWERRAAEMRAKLESDPGDSKTALELVRLLVLDMDEPAEAVTVVPKAGDAALTQAVQLAAKTAEELTTDQLLYVGDWYRGQAAKASEPAKYVALHKANKYYGQLLKTYTKEDATRLSAKMALESVQKDLAREPLPPVRRVIDLLSIADPKTGAVEGTWTSLGSSLVATSPVSAKLAIHYDPPAEYTVRVTFQKPANSSVVVIASSAGHSFAWIAGASDGMECGFELVNGKICMENGTGMRLPAFRQPRSHTAEISVRDGLITATLDGSLVSRYEGDFSALTLPGWDILNGSMLGIRVEQQVGPTIFQRLELAEFGGRGHNSK